MKYHAGYSIIFGILGMVSVVFCFILSDIILFTLTTSNLLETPIIGDLFGILPSSSVLDIFIGLLIILSLILLVFGIIGLFLRLSIVLLSIKQDYKTELPIIAKQFWLIFVKYRIVFVIAILAF
ncbi:MAG: hypothetical protein ACTSQH_10990, partial [Candidatus Hodarchaeales archaeon]